MMFLRTAAAVAVLATALHAAPASDLITGILPRDGNFVWSVIGDSWSSGVAYSQDTQYDTTNEPGCGRSTDAWGTQMNKDSGWTSNPQDWKFAACGGTLLDDIPRQLGLITTNPSLIMSTMGGNNAVFGDIARACIYQPPPGGWGKPYDEDTTGDGKCKQNLQTSQDYIESGNLARDLKVAFDSVFQSAQQKGVKTFDLYISAYVHFFNVDTDDCDGWTFAPWFAAGFPKVVKELRVRMNDLVEKFNNAQSDVIKNYQPPAGYKIHHLDTTTRKFDGHRFCEVGHSFEDQFYSADVYLWNLSWNDGKVEVVAPTNATANPKRMGVPPGMEDTDPSTLTVSPGGNGPNAQSGSGVGWVSRPFHPKPLGYQGMKDYFIQTLKDDKLPGVGATSSTCQLTVREIQTCEAGDANLYAEVVIKDPSGKVLYSTPGSTHSPGQPIDDANRLNIKVDGMSNELVIVGEHVKDYIQFYYGSAAWTSTTTDGPANCKVTSDGNWRSEGPENCPAPAVVRDFACQYPC